MCSKSQQTRSIEEIRVDPMKPSGRSPGLMDSSRTPEVRLKSSATLKRGGAGPMIVQPAPLLRESLEYVSMARR